jgi:hypothetical protein
MALDPSIALGVRPVEIQNPLAQYGQIAQIQGAQNQNALAQYQLNAAQRADELTNATNELYAKHFDPTSGKVNMNALSADLAAKGFGAQIPVIQAKQQELEGKVATTSKTKADAAEARRKLMSQAERDIALRPSDANITAYLEDIQSSDLFTPQEKIAAGTKMKQLLSVPMAQRGNILSQSGASASDLTAREQLKVSQGQLTLAQQNAAKPVWNEAGQGWVTPPNAKNPQGGFTPIPQVQETKDQRSAVKALKTAGYNVETGDDEISKLIEKSTGGVLSQAGSAVAGAFNYTTEGREAIGRLKTRANQISLDMLGGKLGAGISNDDRNFIVNTLGNVADPSVPVGDRLAAWDEAKKRMVSSGMLPAPKTPDAAGAVDTSNPLLSGKTQ